MQLHGTIALAVLVVGVVSDATVRVWSQDNFKGTKLTFDDVELNKCHDISSEKKDGKSVYGSGSFEIVSGPCCRVYDTVDCQCTADGSHYCSEIKSVPGWNNWNEKGEGKIWYKAFKCRSPFAIKVDKPNDPW